MARRYLRYRAYQILQVAKENCKNEAILKELLEELKFRSTNEALIAKEEIEELLDIIKPDYFEWPTTHAPISTIGFCDDFYCYKTGLLSYVGYSTGKNGEPTKTRQAILDCVFNNELPKINDKEYMDEWGTPKSPSRLKKMAVSIAAFTRNNKRNTAYNYQISIAQWESDLEYLFNRYYVGTFNFDWPKV